MSRRQLTTVRIHGSPVQIKDEVVEEKGCATGDSQHQKPGPVVAADKGLRSQQCARRHPLRHLDHEVHPLPALGIQRTRGLRDARSTPQRRQMNARRRGGVEGRRGFNGEKTRVKHLGVDHAFAVRPLNVEANFRPRRPVGMLFSEAKTKDGVTTKDRWRERERDGKVSESSGASRQQSSALRGEHHSQHSSAAAHRSAQRGLWLSPFKGGKAQTVRTDAPQQQQNHTRTRRRKAQRQ